MIEIEEWKFAFQVLQFLATGAIGIYVYMSNKNKVTNDRITEFQKDVDGKIDNHSERLAKVEVRAKKSPTHDDLSKLHEKINEVSTCMNRMEGESKVTRRILNLIHETMMSERGK